MVLATVLGGCKQNRQTAENKKENVTALQNPQDKEPLAMNSDTLDARIIAEIMEGINRQRSDMPEEALNLVGDTHKFLQLIESGKKEKAIDFGHKLIGKTEVLLTKNPDASLIPLDASFNRDELVTDIETVNKLVKAAQEAMDKGYYQIAGDILSGLRSEIVVNTLYLPAATYPEALKISVALLEDGKTDEAKTAIQQLLGTLVSVNEVMPLPILKAEEMIKEAAQIDSANHENSDKVLNLLDNARYQLKLAEAMGYGKRDTDYKVLDDAIKALEKSVSSKSDSGTAFDSLKSKLLKFKEKTFSKKND